MTNKLIEVLKTFSPEEFRDFDRYMKSPYFNRYKPHLRLVEELKPFRKNFDNPRLSPQFIYEKIYPGKQYNSSTMTNLICDVLLQAEDFIANERFKADNGRKHLYLLKSLSGRGLENVYRLRMKDIKKRLQTDGELDAEYFYMLHELESNLTDFRIMHDKVVHKDSLVPRVEAMEQTYLWLILSHFIKLIECLHKIWLYGEKFDMQFENRLIKEIIGTLDIPKLGELVRSGTKYGYIIELYLALAKIFSDTKDINNYFTYKRLVMHNINKMSPAEKEYHYANLTNYCNLEHNISSKDYDFEHELFGLYEEILFREYYKNSRSSYLNVSLYRSMLLLALKLEKFEWAEALVARFSKCLHPKHAANMYYYGAAMIAVEKHEHEAAMSNQSKIKVDYFVFKYDLYILELRVYYERREVEGALALLRAAQEFLRADKFFKKKNKEYYRMFFMGFDKLLKPPKRKDDAEYYLMKLRQERRIACREWLMKQFEELIASLGKKRAYRGHLTVRV